MSPTAASVLQAAMNLPHEDRAEVASLLWESVEGFATPEIAAAWEEEIARRIADLDSGKVESIPAEEVFRKLREKYGVLVD
jgi:putative addiction module component (TIGR02574 family)